MTFYYARQRGAEGIFGLDHRAAPETREWFADGLTIVVNGALSASQPDDPTLDVFSRHREALRQHCRSEPRAWQFGEGNGEATVSFVGSAAGVSPPTTAKFRLGEPPASALSHFRAPQMHPVKVRLYANPTRAISNFLALRAESPTRLMDCQYGQILGLEQNSGPVGVNGQTNWIESMARARSVLGDDALAGFIPWFEEALKAFCIEMIAPNSAGFEVIANDERIVACNGVQRVALEWSRLSLWRAEVYFDRRYSSAPALMNRCLARVTSGQSEAHWTSYEPLHGAARSVRGASVSADLTSSIKQVLYAKTENLVRSEFRYQKRIRNSLGDPQLNSLSEWVLAVRADAVRRLRWPSMLRLIEPVRGGDIQHLAEFLGALSRAFRGDAESEFVIRMLLTTGGLDSTAPRRLINRLRNAEIIEDARLQQRTMPGQSRRYALAPRYHEIVTLLQASTQFSSAEALTTDIEEPEPQGAA